MPSPPYVFALTEGSIRYGAFPRVADGLEFRNLQEVELGEKTFGSGVLGPTLQEERSLRTGLEDLLSRLPATPSEASLVVPDSWLRIAFTELPELPRSSKEREEVLRWKLKMLVPFKVDELRLRALEVDPLPHQTESHRLLLAFGAESLLSALEATFSSYGIRLGRISNISLSLLEAVREAGGGERGMQALVSVDDESYTIVFAVAGCPILYRHKILGETMTDSLLENVVRRELRLTRTFVQRQIGPPELARIYLFAQTELESRWRVWIWDELAPGEVRTGSEFVRSGGRPVDLDAVRVVPLMGAACTMVT